MASLEENQIKPTQKKISEIDNAEKNFKDKLREQNIQTEAFEINYKVHTHSNSEPFSRVPEIYCSWKTIQAD